MNIDLLCVCESSQIICDLLLDLQLVMVMLVDRLSFSTIPIHRLWLEWLAGAEAVQAAAFQWFLPKYWLNANGSKTIPAFNFLEYELIVR